MPGTMFQTQKGAKMHYYETCPGMNAGGRAEAVEVCLFCHRKALAAAARQTAAAERSRNAEEQKDMMAVQ